MNRHELFQPNLHIIPRAANGMWYAEVRECIRSDNELKVQVCRTDSDHYWFETWNLAHVESAISSGDYSWDRTYMLSELNHD